MTAAAKGVKLKIESGGKEYLVSNYKIDASAVYYSAAEAEANGSAVWVIAAILAAVLAGGVSVAVAYRKHKR